MFWRRQSQQSPEAKLINSIFGADRATQFEECNRTPGRSSLATVMLAALGTAQRFNVGRDQAVARLQRELDVLQQAHPTELDTALLGYVGLGSMIDQGLFQHIGELDFLTTGELLHDRTPLYTWLPVQEWRTQLPAHMAPQIRMWAWYHLSLCCALTYSSCTNLLQTDPAMAQSLLKPGMSRILRWLSLSAYWSGWLSELSEAPGGFDAQTEACKMATAGLNVLIEHFDGGNAQDFVEDLLSVTRRGEQRSNQAMGLWAVSVGRGVDENLPSIILQDIEGNASFQLQMTLIALLEGSIIMVRGVGTELVRADLTSIQQQSVMTSPLTTLLRP